MQTPLAKKLRLQTGQRILMLNPPDTTYFSEFEIGTKFTEEREDVIVLFVYSLDQLIDEIRELIIKNNVTKEGRIFIAYPKKGNKKFNTFLH